MYIFICQLPKFFLIHAKFLAPEDDGYDMVENVGIDGNTENIYGDMDEDLEDDGPEFQVIENPYYGGEVDLSREFQTGQRGGRTLNNGDIITVTQNEYYEM